MIIEINNNAKLKAMRLVIIDSESNWHIRCPFLAPLTFLIPISFAFAISVDVFRIM